jgi:alpha-glucoside transport system substrate-binding protein
MRGPTLFRTFAVLGAAALMTTGCLSQSDDDASGSGANDNTSKNIEIMTAMTGDQFNALKTSVEPYAKSQGITIKWSSTGDFNKLIVTRVQGNNPPDIALFPQPGIMRDLANKNKLVPLDDVVDKAALEGSMTGGTLDVGTVDDKLYGVMASMNIKSLVFYPKQAFDKAGYKAPTTQAELTALADQIKKDGTPPWCMGIESQAATGWPATDWIEDLVLQYNGIDTYNKWVSHDVKFDSPEVKKAFTAYQQVFGTPGNVLGGRKSIASNNFATAGNPMFEAKPGCMLFKQGNFVAAKGFFPDKVVANIDQNIGVFGFPPATAGGQTPILGGGDLASLFSGDNEAAKTMIKFMSTKDFGAESAKAGQLISPHKDFDPSNYPSQLVANIAKIAYGATAFAFDGSDQMPGVVGSGSFWKDTTAWISGQETQDQALKNIDASWPAG